MFINITLLYLLIKITLPYVCLFIKTAYYTDSSNFTVYKDSWVPGLPTYGLVVYQGPLS